MLSAILPPVAEDYEMRGNDHSLIRFLHAAAYVVIVAWGIRAASGVLSIILIALLIAYSALPFPKWLTRRFHFSKSGAIILTACLLVLLHVVASIALYRAGVRMYARSPLYLEHLRALSQQIMVFLGALGIQFGNVSLKSLYSSERIIEFSRIAIPTVFGRLSARLLIFLLSVIFMVEMADPEGAERGPLARNLAHYGGDVQRYVSVTAKTGAINALANLVLLVILGVDFPILWCVLYFFLHFIPNIGFIIALVPPTLVALLTFGWQRALIVAGGLMLTQLLVDNWLSPILMAKGLHVSFLEMTVSLMIWGFLLGWAGLILAVPLTLALRRFIQESLKKEQAAAAPCQDNL